MGAAREGSKARARAGTRRAVVLLAVAGIAAAGGAACGRGGGGAPGGGGRAAGAAGGGAAGGSGGSGGGGSGGAAGAGGGGGTAVEAPATVTGFYEAYFDWKCRIEVACLPDADVYLITPLAPSCQWHDDPAVAGLPAELEAAITRGASVYNRARAATCLQALAQARATCVLDELRLRPCEDVVAGRFPAGAACFDDHECVPETHCRAGATCPGLCEPDGGDGAACEGDHECLAGHFCNPLHGTCSRLGAEGETCSYSQGCAPGLVGKFSDRQCICRPRPREGEPCGIAFPYQSECVVPLQCHDPEWDARGTCERAVPPGGACSQYRWCALGSQCVDGACIARSLPGEPCRGDTNCSYPLACNDGVCGPGPLAGETCSSEWGCAQGECDRGVCRLVAPGEYCGYSIFDECEVGYCRYWESCWPSTPDGAECSGERECAPGLQCRPFGPATERTCRPACD